MRGGWNAEPVDFLPVGRREFLVTVGLGATAVMAAGRPQVGPPPQHAQQRGFALPTYESHGYRDFDTASALRELRAVGGQWVQIVPTWYQDSVRSATIYSTSASVVPDDVRSAIRLAHAFGLKVLLKPHVDPLDGADRSQIAPTDRDAWFRSYRGFLGSWATLAATEGVEEFCVGTELSAVDNDRTRWLGVVADARAKYRGPLVYAANFDSYTGVAFWDALDLVGIDGYWPLARKPTTDLVELEHAYAPIRTQLAAFAARTGRCILFTEAGFPSQVGAAVSPAEEQQSTVPAEAEQAAGYSALMSAFATQPWWAGVFWWTWTVPHSYPLATPVALDHSVRGKSAADVVRAAWLQP